MRKPLYLIAENAIIDLHCYRCERWVYNTTCFQNLNDKNFVDCLTDNAIYTFAGDHVSERKDDTSQLPQSQEHMYEFESSVNKSNEYTYSQVGPYDEMVSVQECKACHMSYCMIAL